MILESVSVGVMDVNCYIIAPQKQGEAIIIDPGAEERKIRKILWVDKGLMPKSSMIALHLRLTSSTRTIFFFWRWAFGWHTSSLKPY